MSRFIGFIRIPIETETDFQRAFSASFDRLPMRLTGVARGAHVISAMNLRETACYD